MLLLQPLKPHDLLRTQKLRLSLFSERQVVRSMSLPCGLHLPIHGQALKSVLADRLQHHEAWLFSLLLRLVQQALVDEGVDFLQHLQCCSIGVKSRTYRFYCLQRATADKDRKSPEEPLLRGN